MVDWSPNQYLIFADERTRAARDLLAQVPLREASLIYDLGCGPGNSTELLVAAYPKARIVGVDHSPNMLEKARTALPQLEFLETNLANWQPPEGADLLFSNATFQWVPEHMRVLQRLLRGMKTGAVLAVQMPDNLNEPSHVAMSEATLNAPYADKMLDATKARDVLPLPSAYYMALKPLCSRIDIWHTIYNHPLDGIVGIVEWLKGTGLRPFLDPLSAEEQQDYLARYATLLAKHYPVQADGKVLLLFPRLFMVAVK